MDNINELKAELFDIIETQSKYQGILQQLEQLKQQKYQQLQAVLNEQQTQEA
jgi:hypothetical protein